MNKLALLLLVLLTSACTPSKYEGYTEVDPDLFYQRVALGEGIKYHPDSCFLDYTIRISSLFKKNKAISKEVKFAQIPLSVLHDSILVDLRTGDQLRFITSKNEAYLNDLCKIETAFDSASYLIEFNVDQVYNLYIQEEDPNVLEYNEIDDFLTLNDAGKSYKYHDGIWLRKVDNSPNNSKLKGEIILDYQGYSLQGEEWDIPDFPLKFHIEDQYQVIRGIEIALSNMHFQDSVEVIIPSYLAFGELGSKNGNIPPYKSLHYQLKVHHPDSIEFYPKDVLE